MHNQKVSIASETDCGKTYLGCVLATQASKQGFGVGYFRSSRLLESLSTEHRDGSFSKLLNQLAKKTDVLVLHVRAWKL